MPSFIYFLIPIIGISSIISIYLILKEFNQKLNEDIIKRSKIAPKLVESISSQGKNEIITELSNKFQVELNELYTKLGKEISEREKLKKELDLIRRRKGI